MSSLGAFFLSASTWAKNCCASTTCFAHSSAWASSVNPPPGASIASDHFFSCQIFSRGTPSWSAMTVHGKRHREIPHEVALAFIDELVDQVIDDGFDVVGHSTRMRATEKRVVDQAPILCVHRGVCSLQGGHSWPSRFSFLNSSATLREVPPRWAPCLKISLLKISGCFLIYPDIVVATDIVGAKLGHEVDRFVQMANGLEILKRAFPGLILKQVEFQ